MTKVEFIKELKDRLSKLPDYEINRTVSFYTEIIDDRIEEGISEEQAVSSLGSIEKIASDTLIDTPLSSLIQEKIKESKNKSKNQTLWLVLVICGFPFWLPMLIAFVSVVLSLFITVWAVVISLFAAELSLAVSGVFGLISGLALIVNTDFFAGVAVIGMSLVSGGLFIITIKPLLWLCRQFISLTGVFLRKIKSLFISKQEA
jgi:uncharacterized membrane protein